MAKTMKIRMRTTSAGPDGVRLAGSVCIVSEVEGKALIDGRYATEVVAAPLDETATAAPAPETAATRTGRPDAASGKKAAATKRKASGKKPSGESPGDPPREGPFGDLHRPKEEGT